jgi:dipeptidyl aminopeptidase/acylaminoacyl peptidase
MNDSEMFFYDRGLSRLQHLSPHQGDMRFQPVAFSPDSKYLYFLTDSGSEFMVLKRCDILSGRQERVDEADWDILYTRFSGDGKYRVVGIDQDGRAEIQVYENESDTEIDLPEFPKADITSVAFSPGGKWMAFYVTGSRFPGALYVYDLDKEKYLKLVESMSPDINPNDLVDGRVVHFDSFDGLAIPGILYRPHAARRGERAPALVVAHNEPGGQARLEYSPLTQILVNHGYVVLEVNYRGSSGYGKTFSRADDLRHGEADLADCVAAREYLASLSGVDPGKIGILGSGYGGTLVLAALASRPEAFTAGVDMFGISNWARLMESPPPSWESYRELLIREMGNPETQGDLLKRISPLLQAGRISKPLLVLQGANDPQALQSESDAIVAALKKKGVPVEYLVFEGEGHGFSNKPTRLQGYEEVLKFLDRYLKRTPQAK